MEFYLKEQIPEHKDQPSQNDIGQEGEPHMNLGIAKMGNEHYDRQVAQSCRYAKADAVFPVRSACIITHEERQGYDDKNGSIGGEVKFYHGFY